MKQDKELKHFTKYVMKEAELKSPSSNFVNNVMGKIAIEVSKEKSIVYEPLISKKGWFIILSVIILATITAIKNTQTTNTPFLSSWELNFLENTVELFQFGKIQISKTFVVCSIIFSVMMLVQVFGIKHFYNKKVAD